MYVYKNKVTGAVLRVPSQVVSPDWEEVKEEVKADQPSEEPKPKKKTVKKG